MVANVTPLMMTDQAVSQYNQNIMASLDFALRPWPTVADQFGFSASYAFRSKTATEKRLVR
jgi:hypothetical protein